MVPFTITDTTINIVLRGKAFTIPRDSVNGHKLAAALKAGKSEDELLQLADPTLTINALGGGIITVKDGVVLYNGEPVPDCLVRRLLDLLAHSLPVQHLANFYERLDKNDRYTVRDELFAFLEYTGIPITPEGMILMYKAVRNDWTDKHTGMVINRPGCRPTMPRRNVCDDPNIGCARGYHAGSLEYVQSFACNYGQPGGDRIVIVEVDPADVISVPKDCSQQKVRTCAYRVIQEYAGKLPNGGVQCADTPYARAQYDDDADLDNEDLDDDDDAAEDDVVMTREEYDEHVAEIKEEARKEALREVEGLLGNKKD